MPQQPPQNPARDDDPTRHLAGPPAQAGRHAATGDTGARPVAGRGTTPPAGTPGAQGYGPVPGFGQAPGAQPTRAFGGGYPPPPAQAPGGYGAASGPYPAQGPATGAQPTRAFGGPTGGFPTAPGADSSAAVTVSAGTGKKAGDLTITKVLAGAGTAAASAVAGSFFGALGTVSGAAAGAVFSSVVTEVLQRSLDKTRDTVKARVKLPGGRTVEVEGKTEVPAPPVAPGGETGQARVFVTPGDRPTEVIPVVPADGSAPTTVTPATAADAAATGGRSWPRRRILVMAGFTVVIFALGMLAITGIELVKGSPLNTASSTSQRSGGTSLGSVLGGGAAAATETSTTETESATETEEPSDDESEPARSTAEEDAEPTAARGRSGADDDSPTTSRTPRPSATQVPDADSDGGAAPNAQGGGGADVPAVQE